VDLNVILIILAFSCFVIYLRYLQIFKSGILKRDLKLNSNKKTVSVIVAARNEENNLHHLLTALVNQSYPHHLFEIIIADDGSEDKTAEIVQSFMEKWDNIKFLSVQGREGVISPKKNALSQAIKISKNEIIMLTDADCITSKYWIESMTASYDVDTSMVVGFSYTRILDWEKASLVQKYEHLDFIFMFLAAAGAISSRKYFSCSGQNLSYSRKAFEKVDGFNQIGHLISGDDVNLMQLMRRCGLKIKFAFNTHSFVKTKPVESWIQLLNQRTRWASNFKWQMNLNPEFFYYLTAVFLNTFLPVILIFKIWFLGLGLLLLRMILEYDFIKLGFKVFELKKNKLKFYPFWFIMQPFYILLVTLLGILGIFKWKK